MFTKKTLKDAFVKTIPVMVGYIVLGMGFGIVMSDAGFGILWALAMSVFIYAGSMQYAGVSLLTSQASVIMTAIMTLLINARHLFYAVAMVPKYRNTGRKKPYLIFSLTDETYSLICDGECPDGDDPGAYFFLVSALDQFYWVFGTFLGAVLAQGLPFDTTGIDFSMTALFTATFTEQWVSTKQHIPAVVGISVTLLCRVIFGVDYFLIPAMALITSILLAVRKKAEKHV